MIRLTETGTLEQFVEPAVAIPKRGSSAAILIPRLVDVTGQTEVFAGRRPTDPPLVVRAAKGLGEITFVGIDLSKPPLADWPDRHRFVQALLKPYVAGDQNPDESQALVARGYSDLSGGLRQRLGRAFAGVRPIGFSLVAALAVAYLLVLGPIDYLFVHRWVGRPMTAWLTFPLIVLVFGLIATYVSQWRDGSARLRINQLELIDIDLATDRARGTYWATLYSPSAERLDLGMQIDPLFAQTRDDTKILLSAWGLTGTGIGGIHAGGATWASCHKATVTQPTSPSCLPCPCSLRRPSLYAPAGLPPPRTCWTPISPIKRASRADRSRTDRARFAKCAAFLSQFGLPIG